jgi:phage terminase large subunit-like protein
MADTHTQEAAAILSLAEVTRVQQAGSAATVAMLAAGTRHQLQQLQGELQEAREEQLHEQQQEERLMDM